MTKLFVCGDIINQFSDRCFIGEELTKVIKSADYAIGNFEGVISKPAKWKMIQHSSTPKTLKQCGFDLMLLANNHITDCGAEGMSSTISSLTEAGLDYMGAGFTKDEVYAPKIITINGERYGFINLSEAQEGHYVDDSQECGYAWMSYRDVDRIIMDTRSKVDYLIIFPHTGLEHYPLPLISVRNLYRHYCNLGADCIIACHPHIAQGIEEYNGKMICYSLGNFFFPRKAEDNFETDIENASYSLILSFDDGTITHQPILHKVKDLVVEIDASTSPMLDIKRMSEDLKVGYDDKIKKQNKIAFYDRIWCRYKLCMMGTDINDTFIEKCKHLLKYLFFRKKYYGDTEYDRLKLLLRLNENETCRFVLNDYLKNYLHYD